MKISKQNKVNKIKQGTKQKLRHPDENRDPPREKMDTDLRRDDEHCYLKIKSNQ